MPFIEFLVDLPFVFAYWCTSNSSLTADCMARLWQRCSASVLTAHEYLKLSIYMYGIFEIVAVCFQDSVPVQRIGKYFL